MFFVFISLILSCLTVYSAEDSPTPQLQAPVLKQITSPDDIAAINHYIASLSPDFITIGIDNEIDSVEKQQLINNILTSIEMEKELQALEQNEALNSPDIQARLKLRRQQVDVIKSHAASTIASGYINMYDYLDRRLRIDISKNNRLEVQDPPTYMENPTRCTVQ